jgi:hypothetical protein
MSGSPALGFNMLEAEAGIVDRLKQTTQQGPTAWARKVGTRDYLATVSEEMQDAPAVYLVYDGPVLLDANEHASNWAHRWLVVIAVSSVVAPREAAPRNQEAGPFLGAVLVALHGYLPPGCTHGLVPVQPPRPYYSEGGKFAYYPLAFMARAHFSKMFGVAGSIT